MKTLLIFGLEYIILKMQRLINDLIVKIFLRRLNIMKKIYKIEVDCANCANLIENAIKKLEGVADATVNFMTQKMSVEFCEGADEKAVMKKLIKTARKIEPDFEVEL